MAKRMKDKEIIAELRARNIELESENIKLRLRLDNLEFAINRIPAPKATASMFKDANTDEPANKES